MSDRGPDSPRVTVIINYLYNPQFLDDAIESVYAQTVSDWEIVLWDNGSDTDLSEIVAGRDDRLRWIRTEDTVGLGEARNRAMDKARGEFTAFLDADDLWLPQKLERQLAAFERPEVGASYTGAELFWPDARAVDKYRGQAPPSGRVVGDLMVNNFTVFSSIMVRSEVFPRFRFDRRFTAVEDTDWLVRMSREWEFAFVPGVLCRYRHHPASFSSTKLDVLRREHRELVEEWEEAFPEEWARVGRRVRSNIDCDTALFAWRAGDSRRARRILRSGGIRSLRKAKVYVASFLPPSLAGRIHGILTGQGTLPGSGEGA